MSFLSRIFGSRRTTTLSAAPMDSPTCTVAGNVKHQPGAPVLLLHCPRCEKPLEGHDDAACARRMSRRFFFGALTGGVAAAVVVPELVHVGMDAGVADLTAAVVALPSKHGMSLSLRVIRVFDIVRGEARSRLDVGYGLGAVNDASPCFLYRNVQPEDIAPIAASLDVPQSAIEYVESQAPFEPDHIHTVDWRNIPGNKQFRAACHVTAVAPVTDYNAVLIS